jgi:hypothetical protein
MLSWAKPRSPGHAGSRRRAAAIARQGAIRAGGHRKNTFHCAFLSTFVPLPEMVSGRRPDFPRVNDPWLPCQTVPWNLRCY